MHNLQATSEDEVTSSKRALVYWRGQVVQVNQQCVQTTNRRRRQPLRSLHRKEAAAPKCLAGAESTCMSTDEAMRGALTVVSDKDRPTSLCVPQTSIDLVYAATLCGFSGGHAFRSQWRLGARSF